VTIAIRPSDEAGCAKEAVDRDRREADYFLREDWTTQISLMRLDKSPFARARFFGHEGAPSRSRDPILPDGRIDQRKSWDSDAMQDGGQVLPHDNDQRSPHSQSVSIFATSVEQEQCARIPR